jgi:hypothetical protein
MKSRPGNQDHKGLDRHYHTELDHIDREDDTNYNMRHETDKMICTIVDRHQKIHTHTHTDRHTDTHRH